MLGKRKRFEDLDDAIQSRNIKFIIGPEKKEYTVYESSFTALSPPLRALLTGVFQESHEGKVNSSDYSLRDFPTMAAKVAIDDESDADIQNITATTQDTTNAKSRRSLGDYIKIPTNSHMGSQQHFAKQAFSPYTNPGREQINAGASHPNLVGVENLKDAARSVEHLEEIFSQHQSLYLLAEKYTIDDLKQLCLDKIGHFLVHYPRTTELRRVVSRFVSTYEKTLPGDRLPRLFMNYCIANMMWFSGNGFNNMVKRTPELAVDLFCGIPQSYWKELRDAFFFD
ncbi:hypothetical protein BDP81DRAFT_368796 [Colletotrichum phormii]|uniref:BTB domain-containing protein n=1 Tax=Colletotrichum phormii TaxID=359342 RepID=A0AAI9ZZN9_9PEZI|nr:uncharacterized protein BDP81DRAFT_368796 [Colletotrichum phormii]KAK1640755.1 hypothetical protein BDP81DRAFT_368796 [Colletotrichum phormii]